ncbi:MAG: Endoglucanase [Myxococcales bacterium]|nr:Endoglucanase [Myxococcales bacterium]
MSIVRALVLPALLTLAVGCGAVVTHPAHDSDMATDTGGGGNGGSGGGGSSDDMGSGTGGNGSCPTGCSVGAKSCDGNGVRSCAADPSGCGAWSAAVACPAAQVCSGGQCQGSCSSQCVQGATYCSGAGFRTCIGTVSGCNDWSATVTACPNGQVCSGGACATACTDRCAPGATQCSGSGVQSCEIKPSGCRDWSDPVPCGGAKVCSGGNCVASCTDQCVTGDKRCVGNDQLQSCAVQASGCKDWSLPQLCAGGGSCAANQCLTCTNGAKRCSAIGNIEQCVNSSWTQTASCAFGCNLGSCVNTVNCTPGAYRCNVAAVEICNSAGSAWLWSSNCAVACNAGLCTGGCTPGTKRCNGANVESCDAAGTSWTQTAACGATGCDAASSSCVLASLTISADTVMEGTVVVAGAVEVMANAKLITNTGLIIRARTITVDQGGALMANPSGSGTLGDGTSSNSYGGCGGGYGAAGGQPAIAGYCTLGPLFGSATDSAVARGGKGGNGYAGANGGLGGGVLQLIASDSISIAGRVSADGAPGASIVSGQNGGGGGGAGGGILVAADNVSIAGTGIISAAGGQPGTGYNANYLGGAGAVGRVKIVYGSSVATNGSITGTLTKGLIPPLTITSTTHPDPSLTYNDDFNAVALSWNQPYANRLGYYVNFDRSASNPPTTTNGGMFQANELLSLDPSKLSSGANYFHVVTEDNMSNIGLIESTYRINLNTSPPSLTSSTHPQATWSTNHNPYFTWTMPVADTNFQGVRYVLDHYANTKPTSATGTFIPTSQQKLQLSNLDDGIWILHMVTVDKQGYQTRNVAHYQAWIAATTPGNGTLNGQISWIDAGTAKTIAGAAVTINRGLFNSTASGSDGKYNLTNLPAGTWEATATAPGFVPSTKQITITAGMPTTTDFQLTKM